MTLGHIKARFHEPTQPADVTTLVVRLEAIEEKSSSRMSAMVNDQSVTDQLKLTYLVGHRDLSGQPNSPLIGRPTILDMSNIFLKNPDDQLIRRSIWTSVGTFLVGSS